MPATEQRPALMRGYAVLAAGAALGLALVYAAVPGARTALAAEDRYIEYATVAVYAAAVAAALVALRLGRARPDAASLTALLAAVAALDEIDWGRRLLELDMPEVEGIQVDTSKRLLEAAFALISEHGGATALALLGIACAALGYRYRRRLAVLWRRLAGSAAFGYVLAWLGLNLLATGLEDVLEPRRSVTFVEELLELCAALALLWAALALVRPRRYAAIGRG